MLKSRRGSVETTSNEIHEETNNARERAVWLRVITTIAGVLLVLFGIIMIAVALSGDNSNDASDSSVAILFVITTLIILPITTGLFLIDIGIRNKIYAKPPLVKTIFTLLTGSAWIVSGLFTAAVSIRNVIQGRSTALPIILTILSVGAVVAGSFLLKGILKKRIREKPGGKA